MTVLHTTAEVAAARRFAFWREAVCETFVQLDCERLSDRPFAGEITTATTSTANFSRVKSRDHQVTRTARRIRQATEETVLVSLYLDGAGTIRQDGREAALRPGNFALYDSTRPYTLHLPGDFEQIVLHMPRDRMMHALGRTEPYTAIAVDGGTATGALALSCLREVAAIVPTADPDTADRLSGVAASLVAAALGERLGHMPAAPTWPRASLLYRAKAAIEDSLQLAELDTRFLAKRLTVSPRYLQALFQEEGTTVSAFIRERRLDRCREELSNPRLAGRSIGEVAYAAGFSDLAHFSKRFREAYGMAPSDYRRVALAGTQATAAKLSSKE
jgi:AraC-like DNA-binding protein